MRKLQEADWPQLPSAQEEGSFQKGRRSGVLLRHRESPEREKTDLPLSQSRKRREEEKSWGSETRLEVVRKEESKAGKTAGPVWSCHLV